MTAKISNLLFGTDTPLFSLSKLKLYPTIIETKPKDGNARYDRKEGKSENKEINTNAIKNSATVILMLFFFQNKTKGMHKEKNAIAISIPSP